MLLHLPRILAIIVDRLKSLHLSCIPVDLYPLTHLSLMILNFMGRTNCIHIGIQVQDVRLVWQSVLVVIYRILNFYGIPNHFGEVYVFRIFCRLKFVLFVVVRGILRSLVFISGLWKLWVPFPKLILVRIQLQVYFCLICYILFFNFVEFRSIFTVCYCKVLIRVALAQILSRLWLP